MTSPLATAVQTARFWADRLSRRCARKLFVKRHDMRNRSPVVTFTFDDVPASAYVTAAPILERYGCRGTFYVSGGLCGTQQPEWRLMSVEECRDLYGRGHEIGCHTYWHRAIQTMRPVDLDDELERSREFLGNLASGLIAGNFAYPYGSVSPLRKRQIQRYFWSCRGVTGGINAGRVDLALLRSVALTDSELEPAALNRLLARTVQQNGWLIFFTHDVEDRPTSVGCTPRLLEQAVTGALRAGCRVLTVREALKAVGAGIADEPNMAAAGRRPAACLGDVETPA